jgi:hypothetical protein
MQPTGSIIANAPVEPCSGSWCLDDRWELFHEKSDVAMPGIFSGERHAQGAAP